MSEMYRHYYYQIPAEVWGDSELTDKQKLFYGMIQSLCNEKAYCWATNKYLANLHGNCSKDTASKAVNKLIERGHLKKKVVSTDRGDERRLYLGHTNNKPDENEKTGVRKNTEGGKEKYRGGVGENNEAPKQNIQGNNKSNITSNKNDKEYNPHFEKFWNIYPKRRGKKRGKRKCLEYWKKEVVKKADEELVIKAAKIFSESTDAKSGYAMDPLRFLRGGYWEDWLEPQDKIPDGPEEWKATDIFVGFCDHCNGMVYQHKSNYGNKKFICDSCKKEKITITV